MANSLTLSSNFEILQLGILSYPRSINECLVRGQKTADETLWWSERRKDFAVGHKRKCRPRVSAISFHFLNSIQMKRSWQITCIRRHIEHFSMRYYSCFLTSCSKIYENRQEFNQIMYLNLLGKLIELRYSVLQKQVETQTAEKDWDIKFFSAYPFLSKLASLMELLLKKLFANIVPYQIIPLWINNCCAFLVLFHTKLLDSYKF